MGRPLEAKVKAFQNEAQSFQQNAQAKGPQWAQQKGAELQQREQQLTIRVKTSLTIIPPYDGPIAVLVRSGQRARQICNTLWRALPPAHLV